jgi:hypothetical protein
MKQLLPLFLLLLPCLALAQYPSNGNQKITLGEQTTADGLIFRGLAADTTRKPSIDTMAYIILDTATNIQWHYKKATSNAWLRVGGSISSGLTGVLPVANGGTGASSFSPNNYLIRTNSTGSFDTSAIYEAGGKVGVGTANPNAQLSFDGNYSASGLQALEMTKTGVSKDIAKFALINGSSLDGIFLPGLQMYSNFAVSGNAIGGIIAFRPFEDNSSSDVAVRLDGRRQDNTAMTTGAIVEFTNFNVALMRIMANGNVGIGQTTPTALLHLKAGTATASTAPLKFTSQGASLLNPVEAGAVEFNGTNLLFTPSTTRHTVNHGLTGSATLNFPSTNAQLSADLTITVTGAADGDVVSLGVPNAAVNANTSYSAWVSAANTVTVRFNNYSSGTVDPASALFKVFVTK